MCTNLISAYVWVCIHNIHTSTYIYNIHLHMHIHAHYIMHIVYKHITYFYVNIYIYTYASWCFQKGFCIYFYKAGLQSPANLGDVLIMFQNELPQKALW